MDADVKARWVAALRSGEYRQGTVYLHTVEDEYCCLGVLCEVEGLAKKKEGSVWMYKEKRPGREQTSLYPGSLPMNFSKRIGLNMASEVALVAMNDTDGRSFAEIADWIEANL